MSRSRRGHSLMRRLSMHSNTHDGSIRRIRRMEFLRSRDLVERRSAVVSDNGRIYTAVDLFAGIGGIRLGFERAFTDSIDDSRTSYLRTIAACEKDEDAISTYVRNFDGTDRDLICRDVHDFNLGSVGEHVDICLAGFPCQAFSMAGKRKGTDDDRGKLFYEVLRICDTESRPEVIFCENVKGLLSMEPPSALDPKTGYRIGRTFSRMLGALKDAGYEPYYTVLNSRNFGVPQNRERLYIVAFDKEVYPDVDFRFPRGSANETTLADVWDPNPTTDLYISEQYLDTLKKHRAHHESLKHGFGYQVKKKSDVASALMCGGMGRERNLLSDPKDGLPEFNARGKRISHEIRTMSPEEWERLQGFEPGYTSAVCKTKRYCQLGNSVTVPVIEAVAREIRAVMERNRAF